MCNGMGVFVCREGEEERDGTKPQPVRSSCETPVFCGDKLGVGPYFIYNGFTSGGAAINYAL